MNGIDQCKTTTVYMCMCLQHASFTIKPLLSLRWVMGIQAIESIKTFVSLILFQNIFIQLQSLSLSLSFPPFFANFLLLWFPGTYVETIDVQLTLTGHGRVSFWCSCWMVSLLMVGKQCLSVFELLCVFFRSLKHISSQIIKMQAINKLMAAVICQK